MDNREAIHKLIGYRRFIEKMAMTIPGYIFDAEPFDLAISALEKQEQESDISCETCKHGRFGDEKCIGCWRRSCTLEDYYERDEA